MSLSKKRIKQIKAMKDKDIDYSDIPEVGDEFWTNARVIYPIEKKPVTIRLDKDIITWFKKVGTRYQSRINAVLRAYVESHRGPKERHA